eukprot:scaffold91417_cov54-Cyclotella_meneghiniana.AAC.4
MMYSYYALALLKVSCPWKRYLTQAQLLQFTSVVIYTMYTAYQHYHYTEHEATETQPIFYKKKYSSKKNTNLKKEEEEDQCHKAMGEISSATKDAVEHAAKEGSKIVANASKVVKRGGASYNKNGVIEALARLKGVIFVVDLCGFFGLPARLELHSGWRVKPRRLLGV